MMFFSDTIQVEILVRVKFCVLTLNLSIKFSRVVILATLYIYIIDTL